MRKLQTEHLICETLSLTPEETEGPGEVQALGSSAEISTTSACIPAAGWEGQYTGDAPVALRGEMCHRGSTGISQCVSGENSSSTPSAALENVLKAEVRPIK